MKILVTGAGGFIGHHLVTRLKADGHWVRGVDIKAPEFEPSPADEFTLLDLRSTAAGSQAFEATHARQPFHVDRVYALAADMGGMGFIGNNHARILSNNALINLNTINGAVACAADRYLFTSSACVYPVAAQSAERARPLREEDAYPADPEAAYGWEKLLTERLCEYYRQDHGLDTRVARCHNVFGPLGAWIGGREKAPAALCRKVAEAVLEGKSHIEVWGDGNQTRSFCYVDDCVTGLMRLMESDYHQPLNLGQDREVSINELARMIMAIAGVDLEIRHVEGPQGVRGRNSDNSRLRDVLGWEPQVSLEVGLARTYGWIQERVNTLTPR